ncbi:hypothetical protein SAMN04488510_1277 [Fervidobacterium changbaicum]|nr:hypothetical protein SAMN04488510_1277 [Fervidobacterium changbaicum]
MRYRGSGMVKMCKEKSKSQTIERVNSIVKRFNKLSGWRLRMTVYRIFMQTRLDKAIS